MLASETILAYSLAETSRLVPAVVSLPSVLTGTYTRSAASAVACYTKFYFLPL